MNLTHILILLLGLSFILQLAIPGYEKLLIFSPSLVFLQPWRLVTPILLHGGILHLLFNCYALFLFGSILETRVTKFQYLTLFIGAGILGSVLFLLTILLGIIPPTLALGASGAIYGILGAVAILFPDFVIYIWGFFPLKMRYAAIFWFILEFMGSFDSGSGIASAGHLGGLIFGLAYAYIIKKTISSESDYSWLKTKKEWD